MINDDLFEFIIDCAKKSESKVVWVGDEKQLQPVKSDKLSKVFSLDNKILLTKYIDRKKTLLCLMYYQSYENILLITLNHVKGRRILYIRL